MTKDNGTPLLPDRHPQQDFFVCDLFDAAPKGDRASMEHPIFSLSTKPDMRVREYKQGQNFIKIAPSPQGLATIHDRDVLIFCISQLMAALNEGNKVSQTVRFKAHDLLIATNRGTDGRGYSQLKSALSRLQGTQIETNLLTGGTEQWDVFSLIDQAKIVRESREGRMLDLEIKLSDWVFNAIEAHEVLTLHRDYFRLRKPLERRIYEIARKHAGRKNEWSIGIDRLKIKCGSNSSGREFRRLVQAIVEQDQQYSHLPDYALTFKDDILYFQNRETMPVLQSQQSDMISDVQLDPETYHDARTVAQGWDVYYLEHIWRNWVTERPRNPDKAFISFCDKYARNHGAA